MTKIQTIAFDARYVNDRYHGIGRHAYNLLDALTRLDQDRRYLAYYDPGYKNTRFDLETLGERPNVELRPLRLPLYSPTEQMVWPLVLAQARVDLFHSPYVLLPLLTHIKSVMTIHDLIFELYPQYRTSSFLQKFYRPMTQLGVRQANLVLTVSEAASRDIQQFYRVDPTNIRVIGNAVDATFQAPDASVSVAKQAEVRARYNLPERFIFSLGVGRPHKNVGTLIDAFARLDPAFTPLLVIGGEPDSRFPDDVGTRIQAHNLTDRVVRTGMIREADLPIIYSLADLFVFPSLVEGFGLPPLEAMACGTPVLASTTPAVAEAVGNAALSFDPRNSAQLAAVLHKALTDGDLRIRLRECGRERIQAFTWERVARTTLQAYTSLETTGRETLFASSFAPTRSSSPLPF